MQALNFYPGGTNTAASAHHISEAIFSKNKEQFTSPIPQAEEAGNSPAAPSGVYGKR